MLIYIIRHGETDLNAAKVIQGWYDQPLNEAGQLLAAETGRGMAGIRFDRCFSSPLKRAAETAEIVLRESGNDIAIEYDSRLKEMCFGDRDGTRLSDEELSVFLSDPRRLNRFPGCETAGEVCARTQDFLIELFSSTDGTYLVSTHGCAMRCMLNFLYSDPSDFWHGGFPRNCAVNIIEVKNGEAMITEFDRVYY